MLPAACLQAIDHMTVQLMRQHNQQEAWIFNTYQVSARTGPALPLPHAHVRTRG